MPRGGKRDGAGRPSTGRNPRRVSICLSGQPEEIELLKKKAKEAGKTVSAFVLDKTIR